MRFFLMLSFLITSYGSTKTRENILLQPKQLKFSYQNYEGNLFVRCKHSLENEASQDWIVQCEENSFQRKYSVHLWITRYTKLNIPKTSFEMLYWVNEKFPHQKTYSSSNWIHLAETSQFAGANLSVGVDEDSAGLYLELSP